MYGNDVNDKSYSVPVGLQRIRTRDGYVIPLVFELGLPSMRLRPFTDAEYDTYPHVVLTCDTEWHPGVLDSNGSTSLGSILSAAALRLPRCPPAVLTSVVEWDPSVLVFDPLDHPDWYNSVTRVATNDYKERSHRVVNSIVIPLLDGSVNRCTYHAHRARHTATPLGIDLVADDVDVSDDPFDRGPWKNGETTYGPLRIVAKSDPVTGTACMQDYNLLGASGWMNPTVPVYRQGSKEGIVDVAN